MFLFVSSISCSIETMVSKWHGSIHQSKILAFPHRLNVKPSLKPRHSDAHGKLSYRRAIDVAADLAVLLPIVEEEETIKIVSTFMSCCE